MSRDVFLGLVPSRLQHGHDLIDHPGLHDRFPGERLKGSIAAARLGQAADVRDLQEEAMVAATRLEVDRNEHWSAFGTTNVLVHRVSALADMQSGGRVIEAAGDISYGDLMHLPRERRASHLLDVTRGHLQAGQRDQAAAALLGADQLAPGEVCCRALTKQIIIDLVRSYPRGLTPVAGVTRLARALREAGVKVLLGSEGYEPHVPHQGSKYLYRYPWNVVLEAVETSKG